MNKVKTNDAAKVDMTEIFDYLQTPNGVISKGAVNRLNDILHDISIYPHPKNTTHLDEMIENHKEAIRILKKGISRDIGSLMHTLKDYMRHPEYHNWYMSKYHIEKIIDFIENKKYVEARRIIYACGFKPYILMLVINEITNEEGLQNQFKELINIHKEMIEDIKKVILNTRVRAIFHV